MEFVDDIDILFDILGNDTRRRILQLLADEPRYFIQLSKDLGVSQQAVLKHLDLLEKHGFVSSYEEDSSYAAPKRKYFKLNRSFMLAVGMTRDAVEFVFRDIPQQQQQAVADKGKDLQNEGEDRKLKAFSKEASQIEKEKEISKKLNQSDRLLKEINERLAELAQSEVSLLRLRQQVTKSAHEAIRESFDEELQRQILYETLGEEKHLNVDQLSAILDTREKEISTALKLLRQRLSTSSSEGNADASPWS